MFIIYLLFALLPLLSQPTKAHDPRNRLCDLIALPLPDHCINTPECKAILESDCQDDTCACAYTAKAEICSSCMGTSEGVDKYNDYLGACVSLDKAAPTTAHTVSPLPSSPAQPLIPANTAQPSAASAINGQFTDITAVMGVETQAAGDVNLEQPVGTALFAPSAAVTTPSVYRGIDGQTQMQAGAATGLPAPLNAAVGGGTGGSSLPVPLNAAAGTNGSSTLDPHGISVINDTTSSPRIPPSIDAGTTALNSSRNFFSQAISQACVRHCVAWKTRADMCSDDRCLCTSDVIYTAGVCNDCVGDSGRGGQIGTCYSEFKDSCELATVGTTGQIAPAVGQGTLTDQLVPSGAPLIPGAGATLAAGQRQPVGAQSNLPYGYGSPGAIAGTGQIQPLLVSDTMGVTYSITGTGLTTQIVTATAGAMIAQETIIVDAGAGCLRAPGVTVILSNLLVLVLAFM